MWHCPSPVERQDTKNVLQQSGYILSNKPVVFWEKDFFFFASNSSSNSLYKLSQSKAFGQTDSSLLMLPIAMLYLYIIISFREKYETPREARVDSGTSLAGRIDVLCVVGIWVFSSLFRFWFRKVGKAFCNFQHKRTPSFAVNDLN